jgi:hypothetical protein
VAMPINGGHCGLSSMQSFGDKVKAPKIGFYRSRERESNLMKEYSKSIEDIYLLFVSRSTLLH